MLSPPEAVEIIVTTMMEFGRSEAVIRWYRAFFTLLFEFAVDHELMGDLKTAFMLWEHEMLPTISEHRHEIALSASKALFCVMAEGHVPYDFFNTLPIKVRLTPDHYDTLRGFLEHAKNLYSEGHIHNVETRCGTFLFWAQVNGIRHAAELDYEFLQLFYEKHNYSISLSKGMILSNVEAFLSYLADKQVVPRAYAFFMNTNRHATLLPITAMNLEDQAALERLRESSLKDFPAEEFYLSSIDFFDVLRKHKYEETVCGIWKSTSESLYLFLHWNNLGYRQEIVDIWYSYYKQNVPSSNLKMSRRILKQYEQFTENGDIDPLTIFSYTASSLELLPGWCRHAVETFLSRKQKEQLATSTVAMYRSSILRLCHWLNKNGVKAYRDITYEHIKRFDIEDPHATMEGKAAYNSRIRGFLMYLEETGLVTGRLFESIPTAYASRDRLVTVLTRDEIAVIDDYIAAATTELELRDAGMIQLGLRMGLRSIDICKLQLDAINWANRSIRFVQQKTKVEVHLPMPVSVGNAIYRYIHERSKGIQSPYVFVPYGSRGNSLTPAACRNALHRALPGFTGGFHCLRKTFSSGLLTRGVKPSVIDDALGHTSNCQQGRYLSLDDSRMMMCPLCLNDEGILSPRRKSS